MEERFSVAHLPSGASNPNAVEQNPHLSACSVTTYRILGHSAGSEVGCSSTAGLLGRKRGG